MPRTSLVTACLVVLWLGTASAEPTGGTIAIVPDPSYPSTEPTRPPPLPAVPAPAPAQHPAAPPPAAPPPVAPPPIARPPAPPPQVAPTPAALPPPPAAETAPPAPARPLRRIARRRASVGHYIIHRDGVSWRIAREGGGTIRGEIDLGPVRNAAPLARAARAGLVTLYVDGRLAGDRLKVTALAGSVPDRPHRARFRW